ncbi:hypothetical protein ROZALSC1DRAFT_25233, partial [Rozella allomycis CSF55]
AVYLFLLDTEDFMNLRGKRILSYIHEAVKKNMPENQVYVSFLKIMDVFLFVNVNGHVMTWKISTRICVMCLSQIMFALTNGNVVTITIPLTFSMHLSALILPQVISFNPLHTWDVQDVSAPSFVPKM